MEDRIIFNIDVMLAKRKMSVTRLSEEVGITIANLSVLKNGQGQGAENFDARQALQSAGLPARRPAGVSKRVGGANKMRLFIAVRFTPEIKEVLKAAAVRLKQQSVSREF